MHNMGCSIMVGNQSIYGITNLLAHISHIQPQAETSLAFGIHYYYRRLSLGTNHVASHSLLSTVWAVHKWPRIEIFANLYQKTTTFEPKYNIPNPKLKHIWIVLYITTTNMYH